MKTFKSYLMEAPIDKWNISWKSNFLNLIIDDREYIYLSPSLIKSILEEKEIETFHGTTIQGLKYLKSIQHTRKTVSSFTKLITVEDILQRKFSGDYPEEIYRYDVLCRLKGHLVIAGPSDIMSIPDEKGTRGAQLGYNLQDSRTGKNFITIKREFLEKIFCQNYKPIYDYVKTNIPLYKFRSKYDDIIKQRVSSFYYDLSDLKKIYPNHKILQKMINSFFYNLQYKFYILCKQFLTDNKDQIIEQYWNHEHINSFSYNEILISNFKIVDILIINVDSNRKELLLQAIKNLGIGNKIVNLQSWISHIDLYPRADSYSLFLDSSVYDTIKQELKDYIQHI